MANKRLTRDQAAKQMAAADNRIKGISSIADNTVRRSKIDLKKQYGTDPGNRQAVTSVDKALNSLAKTTEALAKGVKTITVETARGVKNITASGAKAMNEYAKAITEDIHINRQNFMVTTIGKFTPLVGYAVAKMMETTVFRNMIDKMKVGLGKALDSVTTRFKRLASMGWEKGKEFWNSMMDRISGKRGAVRTRMENARQAKKDKKYFTKETAIKEALADARVQSAARKAAKTKDIEKQVPHMASGGYVQKEGLAKVHAAEVVQPVDKIVETIVDTVNKRLDAKEEKQKKGMFEGTMFEKTKEKDFFGFDKIGKSIRSGMEIMFRKNLALEQRVMKRDKKNQQGLIGSFMTAYSQEAKQEELPLMERQVRAILELKNTISGDQKVRAAAWNKMLYEHPVFHAMYLSAKGTVKAFTSPLKFLFKKRGRYGNKLATRGTVFERLVDASTQTFQGLMEKMDDVIHNTFLIANTTHASALKSGASKDKIDAKKAPGQSGYSISGVVGKLAYKGLVKAPGKAISWAANKIKGGSGDFLNQDAFGKKGFFSKKNVGDFTKKHATEAWRNIKGYTESDPVKKQEFFDKKKKKADDKIKAKQDAMDALDLETKYAMQAMEVRFDKLRTKVIKEEEKEKSFYAKKEEAMDEWIKGNKLAGKDARREKYNQKQENFSSGGKDRSGKPTIFGKIAEMAKDTKKNLKSNIASEGIAKTTAKTLKKGAGFIWSILKTGMSLFSGGISGIATMLGPILSGAIATALAGAAGAALGLAANKYLIKPVTDKIYAKIDKKTAAGNKSSDIIRKTSYATQKDYQQGGSTTKKEAQLASMRTKNELSLGHVSNEARKNFGLFQGVNFLRVQDAQNKYQSEHAEDYLQYGHSQVSKLRQKFVKNKIYRPKLLFGESWEDYGINREKAFLSYLTSQGKVLSQEDLDSDFSSVVRRAKNEALPSTNVKTTTVKASNTKTNKTSNSSITIKSQKTALAEINKVDKRNIYENKVNKAQVAITKWFPTINQFAGNTEIGSLLSGYAADKSKKNPNALLNAFDTISNFSKEKWIAANGDVALWEIGQTYKENKSLAKTKIKEIKETQIYKDTTALAGGLTDVAVDATKSLTEGYKKGSKNKTGINKVTSGIKEAGKTLKTNTDTIYGKAVTELLEYQDSTTGQKATEYMEKQMQNSQESYDYWSGLSPKDKIKQLRLLAETQKENLLIKAEKANEKYGITDKASSTLSKIKQKGYDLKTNFMPMLMTMGDNLITSVLKLKEFFVDAYGDPKQFYRDTKEKLWGGVTKIKEISMTSWNELKNMYTLMKWDAQFKYDQYKNGSTIAWEPNMVPEKTVAAKITAHAGGAYIFPGKAGQVSTITLTGKAGEIANFIPPEEIMGGSPVGSKEVASMGARKEQLRALLNNGMMEGLNGIKNSVDTGTKASIANMHTVINQTSSVTSTNNTSGGGSIAPSRPIDDSLYNILTGNIS